MKKTILFLLLIISLMNVNCFENGLLDNCMCTEVECMTNSNPVFTLNLDLLNYPNFSVDTVKDIVVIQTDTEFNPIDTVALEFAPVMFESKELIARIGEVYSGLDSAFSESILIIKNQKIDQIDTISNITYNSTEFEEVCNTCSGGPSCEDITITLNSFDSPQLFFNSTQVNSFDIEYKIKE